MSTMWKYLRNAAQMLTQRKKAGFSNAVVLMQACQGDAVCFYAKAKALY